MQAKQNPFRFALGPPCDEDDADRAASEYHVATVNGSAQSHKRQRVETQHSHAKPATTATQQQKWGYAEVRLVELIQELQDTATHDDTTHYGLFVWPSAMVLAHFVARYRSCLFADKVVMEIGCGTGLPGILAALCGKPKAVYLTDRSDAVDIQRNVEVNIRINRIEEVASFLPLDWGEMHGSEHLLDVFRTVDVLLAADCFYQSEGGVLIVHALQIHLACALGKSLPFLSHHAADFEKVIASVALIFRCNPNCKLYVTYQLRSISRSIAPLLARWGMTAKALETASFVPGAESETGIDHSTEDQTYDGSREQRNGFDSVYMFEISSLT